VGAHDSPAAYESAANLYTMLEEIHYPTLGNDDSKEVIIRKDCRKARQYSKRTSNVVYEIGIPPTVEYLDRLPGGVISVRTRSHLKIESGKVTPSILSP
jgi:hypothetical protein